MDNMTFEQAEQLLTIAQKDRIARCLWEELKLPQGLNEVEKAFAFGLYTFVQYEDRGALRQYFAPEEGQPAPEHAAHAPEEPPVLPQPEAPEQPAPAALQPEPNPEIAMPKTGTRTDACAENIDLLEIKHTQPEQIRYTQAVPKKTDAPAQPPKAAPEQGVKKEDGPCIPISRTSPTSSRRIWRRW